jgi:dihydroorotate dehydrogenase (NAD+) catalytic subunit
LYFTEECKDIAEVHIATDDGSAGFNGRVTDALRDYLETLDADTLAKTEFYNCGPEPMIHAAEAVQREFVEASQMFSAIDYTTKCGVGICGACASPDGRRICVDGPFINTQ